MQLSNRLNQFQEGIFTTLQSIKNRRIAEGKYVCDLSVGTPNIPPAEHIRQTLANAALDPSQYVYAISDTPALQNAAADWYRRRYQVVLNPQTELTSLLGSQEGLSHIAMAFSDAGDTILVPDPCYPVFADGPLIAGAKLHYMPMRPEKNFLIQLRDIPTAVARTAKMIIVSYPNNPTCALAPDSFYRDLIIFAKEFNIMVLHDNAYSELVFDGASCGSFLRFPGAKDVGVEFNSLSKTYGLAGARIGFCLGNNQMVGAVKKLKSNMDYGMFLPIQKAAIAAISGDQSCVTVTRRAYEARRDALCERFAAIGWPIPKSQGTMFAWAPIPPGFASSQDFVLELVERSGVLVTPGSAFGPGGEGFVRIALVQDEEQLCLAAASIHESEILGRTSFTRA